MDDRRRAVIGAAAWIQGLVLLLQGPRPPQLIGFGAPVSDFVRRYMNSSPW